MTPLAGWENFYVIVGSSAGALIGLQFVVITLIADTPAARYTQGVATFATPTIIHFAAVLLLAAVLNAPWDGIATAAVLWGLLGLGGALYSLMVARRMGLQTVYRPQFEDWSFHVLLPVGAYATLAATAYMSRSYARESLFGVAAAVLLLLFSGIHNAWDSVTYHVFYQRQRGTEGGILSAEDHQKERP
jgi:hypothetical protein